MPKPEKNKTGKPREVPEDVAEKQEPSYSGADFDRALERSTRKLEEPSEPDPGSPRR
jgi:hypothetical protein